MSLWVVISSSKHFSIGGQRELSLNIRKQNKQTNKQKQQILAQHCVTYQWSL